MIRARWVVENTITIIYYVYNIIRRYLNLITRTLNVHKHVYTCIILFLRLITSFARNQIDTSVCVRGRKGEDTRGTRGGRENRG